MRQLIRHAPSVRRGLAGLLTAVALAAVARPALACSCIRLTPLQAIEQTPVIFSGRVLDVQRGQPPSNPDNVTATIAVLDRWKGEAPDRATVYGFAAPSSCGYSRFPVGEVVTLLASPVEERGLWRAGFSTNACLMATFHADPTAMSGLLSEFRARRERAEAAVLASPGAPAPLLERARLLEHWKDSAAIEAYADLAARAPDLAAAHLGLTRVLLRARRVEEAKAAVTRAQALAPSDTEAIRLGVQVRLLAGDTAVLDTSRDFRGLAIPRLDRPGRDLRRWDLSGARVTILELDGADLRGTDLRGLSASTADLSDARLDGAKMAGVRLDGASLRRASLRGVVGPDASFAGADLTGASLDGASLPGADFRRAKLIGATFGGTRLVGADFSGADLDGADLSRADLRGAGFEGAYYGCRTRVPHGLTPQDLGMYFAEPSAPPCR